MGWRSRIAPAHLRRMLEAAGFRVVGRKGDSVMPGWLRMLELLSLHADTRHWPGSPAGWCSLSRGSTGASPPCGGTDISCPGGRNPGPASVAPSQRWEPRATPAPEGRATEGSYEAADGHRFPLRASPRTSAASTSCARLRQQKRSTQSVPYWERCDRRGAIPPAGGSRRRRGSGIASTSVSRSGSAPSPQRCRKSARGARCCRGAPARGRARRPASRALRRRFAAAALLVMMRAARYRI